MSQTEHQHTTMTAGQALRRARELAGVSERTAAQTIGVRRSELRDWESGRRQPDTDTMQRAVRLYSTDLDRIWPNRAPLTTPDEPGVLVVGDERIPLVEDPTAPETLSNRVVLTRYLAAVRRQRGLDPADAIELRAQDIASLSAVLDLGDDDLEAELATLLNLTPAGARTTVRALVVGTLMAVGAATVVGGSWFAADPADAAIASESPAVVAPAPDPSPASAAPLAATPTPAATTSPFSIDPVTPEVELAPAVFAVAPATEWSPVVTDHDVTFSTTPTVSASHTPAQLAVAARGELAPPAHG